MNKLEISSTEHAIRFTYLLSLFYFTESSLSKNYDSDIVKKQNKPPILEILKNVINFGFTVTVIKTPTEWCP